MNAYVLGFAFDKHGDNVVLIRKAKPAWQAGLWNGVGGSIESDETELEAMCREFYEETGVLTTPEEWKKFGVLTSAKKDTAVENDTFVVWCFALKGNLPADSVVTKTKEKVAVFPTFIAKNELSVIPNVRWLIPAALAAYNDVAAKFITAEY